MNIQHNSQIVAQENEIVRDLAARALTKSTFPLRPTYRKTLHDKSNLAKHWTNYFRLDFGKRVDLHQYSVSVADKDGKEPKGKKKRVVELLLELPLFASVKDSLGTDCEANMVSVVPIKEPSLANPKGSIDRIVHYRREGDEFPRSHDKQYTVHVTRLETFNTLELSKPWDNIKVDKAIVDQRQQVLQCLNIFFGHYAK